MGQTTKNLIGLGGIMVLFALPFVISTTASANQFTSPNFKIDTSVVGGSIAGGQTSTNYSLTSSGGESVVGNGASGSYKMGEGYISTLESSLQLTVQPAGLTAYYAMDSGVGTAVLDESTNNSHGATVNAAAWTTGKIVQGLSFNGTNQEVSVPHSASLSLPTDFSVSAWVKPGTATQSSNARILSKFDGTNANYLLAYDGTGRVRLSVHCGVLTTAVGTTAITNTATWYNVSATKQGNILKLYVNGVEEGTATCTGATTTNTANVSIGSSAGTPVFYNGDIDEVKIFNRALSAEEMKAEYDAQNAGLPAGLSFAGGVTPGVSKTSSFDSVMLTDAPGYTLAINQNNNLTSGGNTIAAVSGSIGSPVSWVEGTTKGLGFTLYGTNATAIAGTWNAGASYAALPNSGTTFYTRTGLSGGVKDFVNMRLRLDTTTSQASGLYTNQMTITGTMTP